MEQGKSDPPGAQWPHLTATALALYALVGGVTSFLGWTSDMPRLTDWLHTGISIQPNASIATAAAGTALLLMSGRHARFATVLGALVAAIGGTTLLEWVTGVDLGIDTLLMFDRTWGRVGVIVPGRMGLPGATSWTLIGISVMLAGRARSRRAVPVIALLTAAVSGLSFIGYLYGANVLYAIPTATVIAFQTSTFVLAVSLGLILSVPDHRPMRFLVGDSPAALLVRRILPSLILVPLALGFLGLAGQRAGLYDGEFATAARTLLESVLFLALLWWTADAIGHHADARKRAEVQLEADLADSTLLQRLSAEIIQENEPHSLYERVTESALIIMRAHCSSLHAAEMDPFSGTITGLRLLCHRNLSAPSARFWEWVSPHSPSALSQAVLSRLRVIVPDVLQADFMASTPDLQACVEADIRSVQSTPLISRTGRVLGILSTYRREPSEPVARELRMLDILGRQAADLIERVQAEESLRNADRRKDEFLMTLAHELRNPLAPVRSAVDFLKHKPTADPELARARDVIDRHTSLMARLLDDLLDVGRITIDRLELRPERVDVGRLLADAVEMTSPLFERAKHELHLAVPVERIYLRGDPVRLGQAIGNLLNNACKYTTPHGHVWIHATLEGAELVITIKDTGIGIPADKLASIFDMFSQVDSSIERTQGGLGIGLHLSKRLVEMHGGTISAKSEGLGFGSEFTVRLPYVEAIAESANAVTSVLGAERRSAQRVLVVDDNEDAAVMLSTLLEIHGYETSIAHDGRTAIAAAESLRPEAILLDIGLPGLNGYDVALQIREQPWGTDIVLIAVTGWGQDSDRHRSRESGFDHHLVKPVDHESLLRVLAAVPPRTAVRQS